MVCLVYSKHSAVHYNQSSPLWSHLSKHRSRSFVVCSNTTLLSCAAILILEIRDFFFCHLCKQALHIQLFFLTILSWTLIFNMQTEACRVWDAALWFLQFLWVLHVWPWGELTGTSTWGKINNCPFVFPMVNNISVLAHIRILPSRHTCWWSITFIWLAAAFTLGSDLNLLSITQNSDECHTRVW